MKTLFKGLLIGGGTVAALGTGAGVATGIILPKALEAKHELEKVAVKAGSDPSSKWDQNKKINLVVLGDSESRGMNYTGRHGAGYGDFLASDLKKANKLASYRNFSKSGARTLDQIQLFSESRAVKTALKDADIVTLTLGANDLLQYINMFGAPMGPDLEGDLPHGPELGGVDYNDASNSDLKAAVGGNPSEAFTQKDRAVNTLNQMISVANIYQTKETSRILTVEGKTNDILNDIKNTFTLLVHQLHEKAPNARIEILGHAFPFTQWPDAVLNQKREDLGNISIVEFYDRLMDTMDEGAHKTLSGSADYVKFTRVDDISAYKIATNENINYDKTFDDYVIDGNTTQGTKSIYAVAGAVAQAGQNTSAIKAAVDNHYLNNAFPSSTNIHPSVFGYQIIGNSLFSTYAQKLGLDKSSAIEKYTYVGQPGFGDASFNLNDLSKSNNWLTKEVGLLGLIDSKAPTGIGQVSNLESYFNMHYVKNVISAFKVFRDNISEDDSTLGRALTPIIRDLKQEANSSNSNSLGASLGVGGKKPLEKTPFNKMGEIVRTIFGLSNDSSRSATKQGIVSKLAQANAALPSKTGDEAKELRSQIHQLELLAKISALF